jgi:hypothetical protein
MFKNESVAIEPKDWNGKPTNLLYGYNRPSPYLWLWSRLLQSTISQAGTYMLSGKFHTRHCAIYKCEGGCVIDGKGDLVLGDSSCHWDCRRSVNSDKDIVRLCSLITDIVLKWNPNDPIDSMIKTASEFIGCTQVELMTAIKGSDNGGIFGGNAICDFFNHNPFDKFKVDEKYERFCLVKFNEMTDKDVDQKFADRNLGEVLLEKMIKKCRESNKGYVSLPMCCSPRRGNDGLGFWINTGRCTQIDGWKTEKQINEFLNSDGILHDTAKF